MNKNLLRQTIYNMPIFLSKDGMIRKILGTQRSTYKDSSFYELFNKSEAKKIKSALQQAIEQGKPSIVSLTVIEVSGEPHLEHAYFYNFNPHKKIA